MLIPQEKEDLDTAKMSRYVNWKSKAKAICL